VIIKKYTYAEKIMKVPTGSLRKRKEIQHKSTAFDAPFSVRESDERVTLESLFCDCKGK
jgi:hypothetical protein